MNTFESWAYTVSSSTDKGTFKLWLMNPITKKYWQSVELPANAEAWQIRDALNQYTTSVWGAYVNVKRYYLDANGTETNAPGDKITLKYNITLNKLIKDFSTTAISITKATTKSSFTIVTPQKGIKSSAPIEGSYIISCDDS